MRHYHFGLLTFILLTGCEKPAEPPPPPRPALIMEVGAMATENAMTLVGEVKPRYESGQGFRIDGKIIVRTVDVGAKVKKGQIIAKLDAADTQLTTAAALAEVQAAEASHALAVAEVARQRQLFAKKFISASALDIKESELKASSARLAKVKAEANVSGNQTQYTSLTADRDGVVTFIHAEPGQVVSAGETIVQIADTHEVEVLVAVPESRLAEVKLHAPVTLRLWADRQKTYTGVIREIAPAADSATRTFNARISINNADADIKLGMTAGVKFLQPATATNTGFLIPSRALTTSNGKSLVWIIDAKNQAQPREVVTGPFREDGVLITQGIQAGEKIAIAGVHTLVKDQVVRPVVEAAP